MLHNGALYRSSRIALNSTKTRKIIKKHNSRLDISLKYPLFYLKVYYSTILTTLTYFLKNLYSKNILEVGFRIPLFLDYLSMNGVNVFGIDSNPLFESKKFRKMSVTRIPSAFIRSFSNSFDAIIERITLSKQYEENYYFINRKYRFRNKLGILCVFHKLLKNNGLLILQDDRGTIFSEAEFKKVGFEKIMKEIPIIFKEKEKYLGWNTLVVYKKVT